MKQDFDLRLKEALRCSVDNVQLSEEAKVRLKDRIHSGCTKKKVAVLFGGCSPEYSVSLQSAHAVITNMDRDLYEPVMIGITKEGGWYRYYGDPDQIIADTWAEDNRVLSKVLLSPDRNDHGIIELTDTYEANDYVKTKLDAVFPVLHGKNGEDGTVQGLIELAGIPLIGCGTLASALCMDKARSHSLTQAAGVRVPQGFAFPATESISKYRERLVKLTFPLFVKPVRAGSSFGISRIESENELEEAVQLASQYDSEIVVEEAISGIEVGCAIMGDRELIIGEVDEIELSGGFFDFTEKYTLKTSSIHVPARISKEKASEIKQTAGAIYQALGCSGFARVDMFLTPDGEIVLNEVNTIPGFTPHSRFPGMMKSAGCSFFEIVNTLIRTAVNGK